MTVAIAHGLERVAGWLASQLVSLGVQALVGWVGG